MRLVFAAVFCLLAPFGLAVAEDAKQGEPKVVGKLQVADPKTIDELAKAIAGGLCTYHGNRIICPLDKESVALSLDKKPML